MKRRISCLLLAALLLFAQTGCGKVENGRENEGGEEEKYR